MSAEASSRASIDLPGVQQRLVDAVRATGKPIVAVLMNGRPLAIPRLHETVPAIVESWFLGVETGSALADVLFGDVSPSGKLPVTFPCVVGQVPIYYAHKNTGRPSSTAKYTSNYLDVPWTPLYPFGFGLSYTTFTYGMPRLSAARLSPGDTLKIEVEVTNAGRRTGEEVAQLYIQDLVASVTRPVKELLRFQRVTLRPGETATLRFALGASDLAFYDLAMRRVVEPGTFKVFVGGSSADVREAAFTLTTSDGGSVAVPEACPAAR